jgi:hypothetical protein
MAPHTTPTHTHTPPPAPPLLIVTLPGTSLWRAALQAQGSYTSRPHTLVPCQGRAYGAQPWACHPPPALYTCVLSNQKIARKEKNSCVVFFFGGCWIFFYPDDLFYKPLIRLQRCMGVSCIWWISKSGGKKSTPNTPAMQAMHLQKIECTTQKLSLLLVLLELLDRVQRRCVSSN